MRHIAVVIDNDKSAPAALAAARLVCSTPPGAPSVSCVLPAGARPGGEGAWSWPSSPEDGLADLQWREVRSGESTHLSVDSVDEILALVEREAPDLIVLGAGQGVGGEARLSGCAAALLRRSARSVLVARTPPPLGYQHIGACVDLSLAGLGILEQAQRLLAERGVLDLIHVASPEAPIDERATRLGRMAHAVHAEGVLLVGDPTERILAWQRRVHADLLVAAAHGPARADPEIDPVPQFLANAASCDVLITRPPVMERGLS